MSVCVDVAASHGPHISVVLSFYRSSTLRSTFLTRHNSATAAKILWRLAEGVRWTTRHKMKNCSIFVFNEMCLHSDSPGSWMRLLATEMPGNHHCLVYHWTVFISIRKWGRVLWLSSRQTPENQTATAASNTPLPIFQSCTHKPNSANMSGLDPVYFTALTLKCRLSHVNSLHFVLISPNGPLAVCFVCMLSNYILITQPRLCIWERTIARLPEHHSTVPANQQQGYLCTRDTFINSIS